MGGYDTHLFLEIIVSEGAKLLYVDDSNRPVIIEYYQGLSGKKVQICSSEEFTTTNVAKFYLNELGMDDLIPRLFKK